MTTLNKNELASLFPDLTEIVCTRTHPELLAELEEVRETLRVNRNAWEYLVNIIDSSCQVPRSETLPVGARLIARRIAVMRKQQQQDALSMHALKGEIAALNRTSCNGCGRSPGWKPEVQSQASEGSSSKNAGVVINKEN